MDRFGEKLQALRLREGMTLKDLATSLGYLTHSYISEIETGKKKPTLDFVVRVAERFNITTDELLRDDIDLGNEKKRR